MPTVITLRGSWRRWRRGGADYRHIAFWARLRYFCRIYLESSRWIRRVENASAIAEFNVPAAPPLARHTD